MSAVDEAPLLLFRTATVAIGGGLVRSSFADGVVNDYVVGWAACDDGYQAIARRAGYGADWRRYGVEHELTHHFLADLMGWRWSWALHDSPAMPWPEPVAWEEHLVGALQRAVRLGEADPAGALQAALGERLAGATARLGALLDGVRQRG